MIKVFLFSGSGVGVNGLAGLEKALRSSSLIEFVKGDCLSRVSLSGFDVLILPGGDSARKLYRDNPRVDGGVVRELVGKGLCVIGICSGGYIGGAEVLDMYVAWGLAPSVCSYNYVEEGVVSVRFTGKGESLFGKSGVVSMQHLNGPAFKVGGGVDVLATYDSGKYKGYPAIVREGGVFLFGPHPELTPYLPSLVLSVIEKGDDSVSGKNYDSVEGYKILKSDFKAMVSAVDGFVKSEKRNPQLVFLRRNGKKVSDYVSWAKYSEMKKRWDDFVKVNKREPNWVTVVKESTPTPTVGAIQKLLQDGTGIKFTSMSEFYGKIVVPYVRYCDPMYLDDKKTLKQSIQVVINNVKGITKGEVNQINCVDVSQLVCALAREMGYTATMWSFRCTSYEINHAVALLNGKEFTSKYVLLRETQYGTIRSFPGVIMDAAAGALNNYALGNHWCNATHERAHREPAWSPYEKL